MTIRVLRFAITVERSRFSNHETPPPLIVHILLRAAEQMHDARRRDRDEHESRQMMGADEDRVDMQRQRQRQHAVDRARWNIIALAKVRPTGQKKPMKKKRQRRTI